MALTRTVVQIGRIWGWLAIVALLGAWTTQVTGQPLLGMTQEHLFSDATVFALLCIASFVDAMVRAQKIG